MGKVHVRVRDEGTGKVTAARVHDVASDGNSTLPSMPMRESRYPVSRVSILPASSHSRYLPADSY